MEMCTCSVCLDCVCSHGYTLSADTHRFVACTHGCNTSKELSRNASWNWNTPIRHRLASQSTLLCISTHISACALAGIGYSDDKMLQTRIFSYADTQRYRLGPNYLMLPVNAPKNVHHNNHHDGVMNFMHRDEEVSRNLVAFRVCLFAWTHGSL